MKPRILLYLVAVAGLSMAMSHSALAQTTPFGRGSADNPNGPTVSPYLNLLSSGGAGVTNYQSLVKPLINQNNAIQTQRRAIQGLQQQFNSGTISGGTGRPSYFMYYSHFYPTARGR